MIHKITLDATTFNRLTTKSRKQVLVDENQGKDIAIGDMVSFEYSAKKNVEFSVHPCTIQKESTFSIAYTGENKTTEKGAYKVFEMRIDGDKLSFSDQLTLAIALGYKSISDMITNLKIPYAGILLWI